MNIEEYISKATIIRREEEQKAIDLAREYAFSNSTVKVGDIVTDHIGKVRVEKISLHFDRQNPSCTYFGTELKKDSTPRKDGSKRTVWQSNIKEQP